MTIVFDCRYSSVVYGDAGPTSDDDTRYVFWESGVTNTVRRDGQRWGYSLDYFLRQCLLGTPNFLDWLFLPASAYTTPLPDVLMANRQKFITTQAWRSYANWANRLAKDATRQNYSPKTLGHAYIYMHSAETIGSSGVPDFACTVGDSGVTIKAIRASTASAIGLPLYQVVQQRVAAQTPKLSATVGFSLTQMITQTITGVTTNPLDPSPRGLPTPSGQRKPCKGCQRAKLNAVAQALLQQQKQRDQKLK